MIITSPNSPNRWLQRMIPAMVCGVMLLAIVAVFIYAPRERTMGDLQRIFYFHVASAWVAFLAFFLACIYSIGYLATRRMDWDHRALASVESGMLFCSLVLITGPLWAKRAWGIWWAWGDIRLASTLVLWLIYATYLMLRSFILEPEKRATLASVVAIVGFINVPIVYLSIRWWNVQHPSPVLFGGERSGLDPAMLHAFLISLLAFTLLYLVLYHLRFRLAQMEEQVDDLYRRIRA